MSVLNSLDIQDHGFNRLLRNLESGEYFIDYHDSTHLEHEEWVQLLSIKTRGLEGVSELTEADLRYEATDGGPSFVAKPDIQAVHHSKDLSPYVSLLRDQLSQCFVRAGMLRPIGSRQSQREIFDLHRERSVLLIPDTNALGNGSIHWLSSVFSNINLNLVPIAISLHQIQEKDRKLKSLLEKDKVTLGSLKTALRCRALVNNAFSLLHYFRGNYEILEVPPELLRYVRPSSGKTGEQDETDVLEDRLLIESIHRIIKKTRSKCKKLVVTADVTLSRVLHAEAIPFLSLLVPILEPDKEILCFNFDPISRRYSGCTLPRLLWLLLQVFSEIRLRRASGETIAKLALYWPSKTADDWTNQRFQLVATESERRTTSNHLNSAQDVDSFKPLAKAENTPANKEEGHFSGLASPQISLLPIIQLASVLPTKEISSTDFFDMCFRTLNFSESQTKNAGEVLIQTKLLSLWRGKLMQTELLEEFAIIVNNNDLDRLDKFFDQYYEPYKLLRQHLIENGSLPEELSSKIQRQWSKSSKFAYRNLRPFFLYLGQASLERNLLKDGTNRPSDNVFVSKVLELLQYKDLLPVSDLIQSITTELNMSPWSAKIQLEKVICNSELNQFRFDAATQPKSLYSNKILTGPFSSPELKPVSISSIEVGGKPIFTVARV